MTTQLHSLLLHYTTQTPLIATFEWKPLETTGASPAFLITTVFLYLLSIFALHRRMIALPRPSRSLLRRISAVHSFFLMTLSFVMAVGCSLAAAVQMDSIRWLFCFPKGAIEPSGPVFFWAQVFYLSKVYEFVDTLLIILASEEGNNSRLSFLHIYHHALVVVMCYIWLATAQSLLPVALVTNASVHVLMYGYYLSCSLGWRWPPKWKKIVTACQIIQFLFSFLVSLIFLGFHFFGGGCSGMNGWIFNAVFNATLLVLFIDFHNKSYFNKSGSSKKATKEE